MSMQFNMWKRLVTNKPLLLCQRPSIAISVLPPLPFYEKSHIKLANYFNQKATPSTTSLERGVVTGFLMSKCGLTEADIIRGFSHCNGLLRLKSTHNMEGVLEMLKACGLTTPAQFRRVVLRNPMLLFDRSERKIKSKLSFLRTFIKEEDIPKLVLNDANIFDVREEDLKSASSILLRLGFEGKALSHLVAKQPHLLKISEENVLELFKQVENLGMKKGSESFATAVSVFLKVGKGTVDRKLQCLKSLSFSEKQISKICSREPGFLSLSEEDLRRNVGFLVDSVGLLIPDLVNFPRLFTYSLENRIIPRYRVMMALKSMQVQESKSEISLPEVFYMPEERFLKIYVNNNSESSTLVDIYHGRKARKVTKNKETSSECASIKEIHTGSESSPGIST